MHSADQFRVLNVHITLGTRTHLVTVLATRKDRGLSASQRVIHRVAVPAEATATAAEVLQAAAEALSRAADAL
jgi:hypothetical protein